MMTKRIGFFGGSFDPIHLGHLNLARELMEKRHLDEVWFCPAGTNPLKMEGSAASAADRMHMVKLAIEGEPKFKVLDIEAHKIGPCFTVDTLKQLHAARREGTQKHEFFLMLGDDIADTFYKWHQPDEIIRLAEPLIGTRYDAYDEHIFKGSPEVVRALQKGITHTSLMDISSTEVRNRLGKGMDCSDLIPSKVLDYIHLHRLYSK